MVEETVGSIRLIQPIEEETGIGKVVEVHFPPDELKVVMTHELVKHGNPSITLAVGHHTVVVRWNCSPATGGKGK